MCVSNINTTTLDELAAPLHPKEAERLAELKRTGLLDTLADCRIDRITELVSRTLKVPTVLFSLVDEDRQWFKSMCGFEIREIRREVAFCAHAILERKPFLIVPDAREDARFAKNPLVTGAPHIRAYCGRPIRSPSGLPIGTLCAIDYAPRIFDEDFLGSFDLFAGLVEHEIYRSISGELVSARPGETGRGNLQSGDLLKSNEQFEATIKELVAFNRDTAFCCLQIGIPKLGNIARNFGTTAADEVVSKIADSIKVALRDREHVIGRGAFCDIVAICGFTNTKDTLDFVLEDIESAIGTQVLTCVGSIQTPVRVGADILNAGDQEIHTVFWNARTAHDAIITMEPGVHGKLFTTGMAETVRLLQSVMRDLPAAISKGQIELFFQPKIDVSSSRICSVESLLRWQHPEHGWLPPIKIIEAARVIGIERELDNYIIRQACFQFMKWRRSELKIDTISVNISSHGLLRPDFVEDLATIISETRINPVHLEIEILEDSLIVNFEETVALLAELRHLGVKISLDDFGTGQSSLSYLQKLPLDIIKIDREFFKDILDDPRKCALARQIINLGKTLGLKTVAEGIETAGQYKIMQSCQCDMIQGYFFSRPLPATAFEALYRRNGGELQPQDLSD
ncbi:EAL domain-containing protein [Nisaea sp.]|uniref:sensor domain-containing phosphodiesterase n=1 Tax=Nisaea sp. TaxID=2024842 RepID=UPI002B270227|nr:EAL domain-containing protein [Nisaea sp.]